MKNINMLQTGRWGQLSAKRVQDDGEKGLNVDFIVKIYRASHQESIDHQTRIANE
jgi:chorismate mutase